MILSYKDLRSAWKKKTIRFDPDIDEKQIGLSSIDLRLGQIFTKLKDAEGVVIQPARGFDPTGHVETVDFSQLSALGQPTTFRLKRQEFRVAFTLEKITLPAGLAANVQGKSSLARSGLAVHITAPHIHPAFHGPITLEIYNHGPWELELFPGEDLVCQLILYKVTSPVPKVVADAISTYRGQTTPFPRRDHEKPIPAAKPRVRKRNK